MKRIWILNHYATDTFFDRGGRHYYFAKYLRQKQYDVTVFCASTVHNARVNIAVGKKKYKKGAVDGIPYVFVKTSDYEGNGISRLKNMADFYFHLFSVAKEIEKERGKPQIILASSVHPLTLVAGIQIGRDMNVPCVCEIRDLWPESIVEYSGVSRKNPLIRFLYQGEKWIYKRADSLIFTMEGGKKYLEEKGWAKEIGTEKIYHINNGVDLETFDYNKDHFPVQDEDLENENLFKVIYTGSIRKANHLETLIRVAELLKISKSDIKLLIWGDGDEKEHLEEKCRQFNLKNIAFKGRVEKKYIPYIVSRADVNFMHGEYTDIMRFGCSSNKLFDYLAAGKTILTDIAPYQNLIDKYRCGVTVKGNMPEQITTILIALEKEKTFLQEKYGDRARKLADRYDFKILTDQLEKILNLQRDSD